jgi:hypothetical protein
MGLISTLRYQINTRLLPQPVTTELIPERMPDARLLPDRMALLHLLAKGGTCAEIGVDEGDFSRAILDICEPQVLHLVDLWPRPLIREDRFPKVKERFAKEISSGQVQLHRGDSLKTLEQMPDASLDWVYIDSAHTYAHTMAELTLCDRKVKPDGTIAGHDYAVGSWDYGVRFGVVRAVNEFCNRFGWHLVWLTNEADRHVSFALRKG